MNLSKRLVELRLQQGLTQQQLADYLNISRSTICHYETGHRQPSLDILLRIADYFLVSLDYIMCRTDFDVYHSVAKSSLSDEKLEQIINVLNYVIDEVAD